MEEPLDFELDDPLRPSLSPVVSKRRKIIGLDDLLTDHYKEGILFKENDGENAWSNKICTSDDDDDKMQNNKERELSKFVESCHKKVHEMATEDDIPSWGLQVFGHQKSFPDIASPDSKSCKLQFFPADMTNLTNEMDIEGDSFLEGLLKNGWLLKLVILSGHVENSIASWAFHKMMYSSDEDLHLSACAFWCSILSSDQIFGPTSQCNILNYAAIKAALETYGYLFGQFSISSTTNLVEHDPGSQGPPSNIRSWVRFVAAFCKTRRFHNLLSTAEVEELSCVVLSLFLERKLQGLSFLLDECLISILNFFLEEEWCGSCEKIAAIFAYRIPRDLNCLHIIESISLSNSRSKNLRSEVAYKVLIHSSDEQVTGAKTILKLLSSVNLKEKSCDFSKLYVNLVLFENWFFSDPQVEEKPLILELWSKFLRHCSTQITSTDWRSYASKVRNRASYLLQSQA